jgi:nucleoside-diphosphate-sugar epimerase
VINPGLVLGPAPDDDISTSHRIIRLMSLGKLPALPKTGYPIVDVRDVAALHVLAMTHPAATGQRFLATNGYLTLREMADMLVRTLPDLARKVPRRQIPDFVVRLAARFEPSTAAVLPHLGVTRRCDSRKARELFAFTFRSPSEAVVSAVQSLRAVGQI